MEKIIRPGVKAMLVRDDRLLMVKRSRCVGGSGLWELPGGGMEFGESPEQCLIREVQEETGLTVRPGEVLGAYAFMLTADKQFLIICMLAQWTGGEVVLSDEHEDYRWVSLDEMKVLMHAPMADNLEACGIMGRLAARLR